MWVWVVWSGVGWCGCGCGWCGGLAGVLEGLGWLGDCTRGSGKCCWVRMNISSSHLISTENRQSQARRRITHTNLLLGRGWLGCKPVSVPTPSTRRSIIFTQKTLPPEMSTRKRFTRPKNTPQARAGGYATHLVQQAHPRPLPACPLPAHSRGNSM